MFVNSKSNMTMTTTNSQDEGRCDRKWLMRPIGARKFLPQDGHKWAGGILAALIFQSFRDFRFSLAAMKRYDSE